MTKYYLKDHVTDERLHDMTKSIEEMILEEYKKYWLNFDDNVIEYLKSQGYRPKKTKEYFKSFSYRLKKKGLCLQIEPIPTINNGYQYVMGYKIQIVGINGGVK